MLPLVSYVFQDGPWRDTQVRLGYDPREDPQARLYVFREYVPVSLVGLMSILVL